MKNYCEKFNKPVKSSKSSVILKSINFLKNKAKTLEDIYQNARYILNDEVKISAEDKNLINQSSKAILKNFLDSFEKIKKIDKNSLEEIINKLIKAHKTNFKGVGQPLRIVLTGSKFGPAVYDILRSLDKEEIIKRLKNI